MKTTNRLVGAFVAMSAMTVAANAATVTDDFSAASLNAMWQVNDNAGSYNTGGGTSQTGGYYLIHNTFVEGASNISTSMGTLGAGDTGRVDGIIRTDQFNDGRWSNQVVIYFNNENWVGLRLAYENGATGFYRQGAVNGVYSALDGPAVASGNVQWAHNILGVQLTPTNINFYGSTIGNDYTNETNIDANVTLLASVARPASFQGQAYAILGKGFAASNLDPAYLNHNGGATVGNADNYISYARIITPDPVPEPTTLGLLALVGLPLLSRRGRRVS